MVLVSIIGIFCILFIIILFQNVSFKSQTINEILISRISRYLDITKGFVRESALLSSNAACYDVAYKGGHSVEGTRTWICNEPWAPAVDDARFFLGKETLEFLNRYASKYNVTDPSLSIENFTCVNYNASQYFVESGITDEKLDIEAFGSKINVTLGEDNATSGYDFDLEIPRIRFWYMYRIFKKWSETTSLPQDICAGLPLVCGCNPSLGYCRSNCPSFETYSSEQIEKSRKYLESLFNNQENIECTAIMDCCKTRITGNDASARACLTWEEWPCGGCNRENPSVLCVNSILSGTPSDVKSINIIGKSDVNKTRFLQFNVGVSIAWKRPCLCQAHELGYTDECGNADIVSAEPKGTVTAMFSCIDKKYSLSI